jgi:hypothetical protein
MFGYQPLAYRGLETGDKEKATYVLQQGKIRLMLTSPLHADSEIGEHVRKHGDGVKNVALRVPDARRAFEETTKRGAEPYMEPTEYSDDHGKVVISGIKTPAGDTIKLFVQRNQYTGAFLPGCVLARSCLKAACSFDYVRDTVAAVWLWMDNMQIRQLVVNSDVEAYGSQTYRPYGHECWLGRNEQVGFRSRLVGCIRFLGVVADRYEEFANDVVS